MRLAIVTHDVVRGDGQGRVAYEIAQYALRHGATVSLLSERVDPDLVEAGAQWIPIRPRQQRINLFNVWEFARLADRALDQRSGQFDVVQGFGFTLTRPHQVSVAQFVHDAWGRSPVHTFRVRRDLYGLYQWTYTTLNTRWERKSFAQAQAVVACSTLVRQELLRVGVPDSHIQVILNAADPQEFHPGPADRPALGLPPDVPLALFAGDIRTPRKNLDTVLRALARVPGVHLAVIGRVERSPYPKLAAELGIAERVHFLGFRRDMGRLMQAADLFVFPSRYEPFGIVVLEAMNCGVPVILAATVGAAGIVTPEAGLVLPDPDDVDAFADAMRTLLQDPQRRTCMGRAAREIGERHTWTDMAERYWKLYQKFH